MLRSKFCIFILSVNFPIICLHLSIKFSFQCNSNLMLCREETGDSVITQVITIALALAGPLIPHGSGLPISQVFLRRIVFSRYLLPLYLPYLCVCS